MQFDRATRETNNIHAKQQQVRREETQVRIQVIEESTESSEYTQAHTSTHTGKYVPYMHTTPSAHTALQIHEQPKTKAKAKHTHR